MNAKKAKAIRRAFRGTGRPEVGYTYHVTAHPFLSMSGERNVRYRFQVVTTGWKRAYKLGKLIYRLTGVLPRIPKESHADIPV